MEHKKRVIIAMLFLLVSMSFVSAQEDIPRIVPYVNDFAGVLTEQQKLEINLLCDTIEKNTTYELAIVIVPNTAGQDVVEYANKIGDLNGVGKKDKDNGIVILWSLENQGGGAIATGRYSESIINDARAGEIGRASRTFFDEGDYYGGMNYIVENINKYLVTDSNIQNNTAANDLSKAVSDSSGSFIVFIIIAFVFVIIFIAISSNDDDDSDDSSYGRAGKAGVIGAVLSSRSRGSGSSGGFSGGSFGGGGFGGGGARF